MSSPATKPYGFNQSVDNIDVLYIQADSASRTPHVLGFPTLTGWYWHKSHGCTQLLEVVIGKGSLVVQLVLAHDASDRDYQVPLVCYPGQWFDPLEPHQLS